jgi:hypothetical protein
MEAASDAEVAIRDETEDSTAPKNEKPFKVSLMTCKSNVDYNKIQKNSVTSE